MSDQENTGYLTDDDWNLYDAEWNFLAYNWQYGFDENWDIVIFDKKNTQEQASQVSNLKSSLSEDSLEDYWLGYDQNSIQLKKEKKVSFIEKIINNISWLFKKKEFSWEEAVPKDVAVNLKKEWDEIRYEDKFPSELTPKEDFRRFVHNMKNFDRFFKDWTDKKGNVSRFKLVFIWKSDIVDFLDQLSTLMNAWIRLVDSILILKNQSKNSSMKLLLWSIADKMSSWKHLSEAMEDYSNIFPRKWVKLILAAEKSWKMSEVLEDLAKEEKNQMHFVSKVRWAMIYPSILLIMAALVFWLMMTKMVPALESAFGSTEKFPPLTLKIIALSHYMQENYLFIIFIPIIVIFVIVFLNSQFITSQIFWNHISLNIPIFWKILRRKNLIIFSDNFSLLLSSWVLVSESLKVVAQVMPSILFRREVHRIRHWVENGKWISGMMWLSSSITSSDNIKENPYFPLEVAQMMKIWEETWNTIEILRKIREVNANKLDNIVKNLTSMLEPLITIVIWLIVWTLLLAFMIPMMSSFKAV